MGMVSGLYSTVLQLTSASKLPTTDRARILNDFAHNFGWTPSDILEIPSTNEFAKAHLIIEHGLENQAVITFLQRRYSDLNYEERKRLLNISYNNLVDWHIQIESDQISYIFNRCDPEKIVETRHISHDNLDNLRSKAFEQISGKRQNPNLPALDDALINTISFWKRNLYSEMGNSISNRELSALFNAIIFTRAVEDNFRRLYPFRAEEFSNSQALFENVIQSRGEQLTIRKAIFRTLEYFDQKEIPQYLIDESLLSVFDGLDGQTLEVLVRDFYRIKYAKPYKYDFSLISKHALSRIYERYTSLLRFTENDADQLSFFPPLPDEIQNKAHGSVYTPQFIAGFFARYLREQMPPMEFKRLRTLEPAIGSGIFLRTLLEIQCDPTQGGITTEFIETAFSNVTGLDIDPNACHSALLSLSLLYLVLTDKLPSNLEIKVEEAIKYTQDHPELKNSFGAVIANPPFVSLGDQNEATRARVADFMGTTSQGKVDLSLAFLKIAIESLKPGGYGLFVLPHKFLLSKSDSGIRNLISQTAWIRCLVDLSAIQVFGDVNTYVILLIFQKRYSLDQAPMATIAQCQELLGKALQDIVEGRQSETKFYNIFNVNQDVFESDEWIIQTPTTASIERKLKLLPTIGEFMNIRVGVQTGSNEVFIVPRWQIPKGEDGIFIPFLSDREMESYTTPKQTESYLFYPYAEGKKLNEDDLKLRYPKTWEYLLQHKVKLEARAAVRKNQVLWWELERSRSEYLQQAKIVSPHLAIMPRFSIDSAGKFAVVRSPVIFPKERNVESELLRYFAAVLNSSVCYRYISEHSHKYGSGYSMLEPKSLLKTPVPDPTKVNSSTMHNLLLLVDKRLLASGSEIIDIETEIDHIVADLYGFSEEELAIYGNSR
ncbi:Eco57I restriction-modification methylase domain-containing protein [Pseudanabaena yagii]|uniref:site-specific DNA-methyltransferase (adenine-specific) n=1 Tax=Pseudanabaena yagii GIHE-NHR1 TaxID=2722753 RepID=A0ABX1LVZ2_9CYAN|nr:N-6 DNA methylase [Pseudanabaena yagii]NMF60362.1 SAM-dependent DNA methyltransferase [Pseudanabaena yagii GIHE-NHR1]